MASPWFVKDINFSIRLLTFLYVYLHSLYDYTEEKDGQNPI